MSTFRALFVVITMISVICMKNGKADGNNGKNEQKESAKIVRLSQAKKGKTVEAQNKNANATEQIGQKLSDKMTLNDEHSSTEHLMKKMAFEHCNLLKTIKKQDKITDFDAQLQEVITKNCDALLKYEKLSGDEIFEQKVPKMMQKNGQKMVENLRKIEKNNGNLFKMLALTDNQKNQQNLHNEKVQQIAEQYNSWYTIVVEQQQNVSSPAAKNAIEQFLKKYPTNSVALGPMLSDLMELGVQLWHTYISNAENVDQKQKENIRQSIRTTNTHRSSAAASAGNGGRRKKRAHRRNYASYIDFFVFLILYLTIAQVFSKIKDGCSVGQEILEEYFYRLWFFTAALLFFVILVVPWFKDVREFFGVMGDEILQIQRHLRRNHPHQD